MAGIGNFPGSVYSQATRGWDEPVGLAFLECVHEDDIEVVV